MSHIYLQSRKVGVAFCVEAGVGVAQDVLHPTSAKARIVPNFAPAALPVARANIYALRLLTRFAQNSAEHRRNFDLAHAARLGALRADCDCLFFRVDIAPSEAANFSRADSRIDQECGNDGIYGALSGFYRTTRGGARIRIIRATSPAPCCAATALKMRNLSTLRIPIRKAPKNCA